MKKIIFLLVALLVAVSSCNSNTSINREGFFNPSFLANNMGGDFFTKGFVEEYLAVSPSGHMDEVTYYDLPMASVMFKYHPVTTICDEVSFWIGVDDVVTYEDSLIKGGFKFLSETNVPADPSKKADEDVLIQKFVSHNRPEVYVICEVYVCSYPTVRFFGLTKSEYLEYCIDDTWDDVINGGI